MQKLRLASAALQRQGRLALRLLRLALLLALTACSLGGPPPLPTPLPTYTPTPPATATPLPSSTPLASPTPAASPTPIATPIPPSPTPELFALFETPLPESLPALTYQNAAQISALALWYETQISDMAWTPDGRYLAVSTQDLVHFYDVPQRRVVRSLYPALPGVVDIEFDPLGRWLVAGTRSGTEGVGYSSALELWQGPDWQPRGVLYGTGRALVDMAFAPDNEYFAAAYADPVQAMNNTDLWLPGTWVISSTLETGHVQTVSFSGDARYLAVSPDRYAIRIHDLVDRVWLFDIETSFTGAVNVMAFGPDGFTLATGHYDGVVNLWDLRTGLLLLSFETDEVIQSLAWSPNGTLIATGGSFENSSVRIWAAGSGELLRTLEGHTKGVTHLAFSPHGDYLVSASYDGTLRSWGIRP
jgi:WD40 repeat protein